MSIVPYISIIALLMLSAFFSGSEIAFVSANNLKLRQMQKNDNKKADRVLHIQQNFESALTTILIGNNLVNIAASSISTLIIIDILGDKGVFFSTLLMTVFILTFGEITPKLVAKKYSIEFALNASLPILILMKILTPINFLVSKFLYLLAKIWKTKQEDNLTITEEEIMFLIDNSEDEGVIDKERSDLLKSSLVYYDIKVKEILTPRIDMLSIDVADDFEEIKKIVLDSSYTRIPVYDEDIDNVIGILHTSDFLLKTIEEEVFDVHDILSEPIYIYETMRIPDVFSKLNNRHSQLGIVVDEYGGTLGCVSVEDVLEELVGEIWDETDTVIKEFKRIDEKKFVVNGDVSIRDLVEYLDIPFFEIESEYNTVGGWMIEMFGRLPMIYENFSYGDLDLMVIKIDETRVLEVLVSMEKP